MHPAQLNQQEWQLWEADAFSAHERHQGRKSSGIS